MENTKNLIIVIILLLVLSAMAAGVYWAHEYNRLVTLERGVEAAWAQVENVYQRRLDLIPNLVETVRAYAQHEQETLARLVELRNRALQGKPPGSSANPGSLQSFEATHSEIGSLMTRLLALSENYPDLKASSNFLTLQDQLEGTENRIAVERMRYTQAVQAYNTAIRVFPTNLVARVLGSEAKEHFKADQEALSAPAVQF
jgi:LemA protein